MIDVLWTTMMVLLLIGANILLLAAVVGGSMMILSLFALWFTKAWDEVKADRARAEARKEELQNGS